MAPNGMPLPGTPCFGELDRIIRREKVEAAVLSEHRAGQLRLTEETLFDRPCFICASEGHCKHREPRVTAAEARARALIRAGGSDG